MDFFYKDDAIIKCIIIQISSYGCTPLPVLFVHFIFIVMLFYVLKHNILKVADI